MRYSIIIATKNAAPALEITLTSVLMQSFPDRQIIVQDCSSTDGTLDLLRQYNEHLDWRSEPDSGIYDAWNRAIQRVTGDWALFLGAGDFLVHKHTLVQCHQYLTKLPQNIDFAYGALMYGPEGRTEYIYNRSLREVYHWFLCDMGLPFPATFVRSSLFKTNQFDSSYTIAGDYAFAADLAKLDNIARLPVWVTFMESGGVSAGTKRTNERLHVLRTIVAPKAHEFVHGVADNIPDEDKSVLELPGE